MPSDPAKLDDGDRILLRECPVRMFVPNGHMTRALAARLKRIRSLVIRGQMHGKVLDRVSGGHNYEITLTRAGRIALGLLPEPPVP